MAETTPTNWTDLPDLPIVDGVIQIPETQSGTRYVRLKAKDGKPSGQVSIVRVELSALKGFPYKFPIKLS